MPTAIAGSDVTGPDSVIESDFDGEFPYRSETFDVTLDGSDQSVKLAYLDVGPREKRPILFVHGNPTWSFAWRHLIKDLSSDYRCIAIDHVGCGRSEKPQAYPYTLAQHQQNLQSLVEKLDLTNITLVAHDWGGAIGCGVAGKLPERFSQICLMNTGAFRSRHMPLRIAVCRWPIIGPLAVRGFNAFAGAAIKMAVEKPLSKTARQGLLAPYNSWTNRVAVQRFVEDIPTRPDHPSYHTLVETEVNLGKLADHPTLLLWGERDWCFTPAFREEFEKRLNNVSSIPYPNAGHYVFEDERENVVREVRAFVGQV